MPTHQHLVDKMRRHSCFVFLFCGIFLPGILGFPQTNSSIDCDSLLPNYEAEPQTSAPPYIIAVSFDNFEPGNEVQVTLEALGGAGFKGFNLQAREIDGDVPVGTFKITDPNTKGLECHNMTNSAVSHANSDVKQKITTTWIAPQDARELQFIATVVQNLENFWVGIQSKTLTPIHSVSVNATGKSKRKLMIELECNKRGGTYSTGRCIMVGPSSSSQNSYSSSQGGVVYTISKSGCVPGGAAGAYGQQACRDSASFSGSGLTYGQSVPSSSSDSSKKVVVVANSNPFPPVRHTFPQSLGSSATRIIVQSGQKQQTSSSTYVQGSQGSQSYGQGYRPQSGSSYSQGGPSFSGSSSSYGQGSQGSQSYGQGYQPQGGSSYGQGGSASYGGSSGCGQGVSYDSNPCHQGGSQGGQGGSYSSQNYGGSQQSGSSSSQSYSDNQDGSYSQNYGGGQGGSSSDTYYENQDSQDFSDDSNPNACDDNDTTYSANNQRSGCAKKKVLVARDTSHVLSRRAYDVQNASSPSNSSHSDIQGGSFIATSGSSNQGGCICPDGSSGHRQGAPGSSYSTYSGNQGGPFFYPGGPYGQGGPGSSHSSYSGNQGGPSFYPGGSYGQGGSSAYDGSSESYGQGGSSTYSGSDAYGQDSLSMGGSETEDNDSALPTGDGQSERDFYSPGGSQSGGHGSSSQSGSYASGQDSSSSGSSQYGGQGSPSSGGSQFGGQGGCDCSGGSSGGSPSLVRSDSSANDSSSSGGSRYNSQDSYSSGASQYGGHESSSYGGSQYGGQGSPSSGGSQYGGQGSPSSGGSQYGGQDPSLPGGSHYGGQGIASSGSSQYSGQGFSSGVRQSGGQGGCVCPGGGPGYFTGTNYHGGQGSYSGSNQYGGQGSYPSGSSQYGGQGGRPSGGRPHGKPGSSSSGGSHQGKPGGSGSGSTYSGKPQSPYSGGSQVSSAGKHSTPQLLMLFSVLSAFALSAAVSKWSI